MGRWSREVARRFLPWLATRPQACWLDVGRGTGALSREIAASCRPERICGIERSSGYLVAGGGQDVVQGDAGSLPLAADTFDYVVSGLVLNFLPDVPRALAEMRRVTRPEGTIAVYVWDYADGMQMLRYFWRAAAEADSSGAEHDEGARFPICRPEALQRAFVSAGLGAVRVEPIEAPAHFANFDDYWAPFQRAQGPAALYLSQLTSEGRQTLRVRLEESLPSNADGSIDLTLRAWAARGAN